MTGFEASFPHGEEAVRAYVAELFQKEVAKEALRIAGNDKVHHCGECNCFEGENHFLGCEMERCPRCGDQLISCDCGYRLSEYEEEEAFDEQIEREGLRRFPYIYWPSLCGRCGAEWPKLYRTKANEAEWDSYIEPDMRGTGLCEPCYARIKQVTNEPPPF